MNERPVRLGAEPRQRWRLIVRRGPDASGMTHRDVETAWAAGIERAAVPAVLTGAARPRPRLVFGAPVPVGMTAEREPLDLYLAERLTIADLRGRLRAALPEGHELVDLYDVWIGSPSVAALVMGAEYRCEVDEEPSALGPLVAAILAAPSVMRPGRKGDTSKPYDLRPLVDRLTVLGPAGPGTMDRPALGTSDSDLAPGATIADRPAGAGAVLAMRLRIASEGGSGRPDEVLDALSAMLGRRLEARRIVRERLVLSDEI